MCPGGTTYKDAFHAVDSCANGHKLTQTEEQMLVNWALDMDSHGYLSIICAVSDVAKILLEQHVGVLAKIGVNWAQCVLRPITTKSKIQPKKYTSNKEVHWL